MRYPLRVHARLLVLTLVLTAGCVAPRADSFDPGDTPGDSQPIDSDAAPDTGAGTRDIAAGPRGLLIAQSWDDQALPTGAGAGQYRVIFLQESMYPLIPEIRAANPEALLLAYQKAGGMRADGDEHPSTGVRVDEAEESWFLHDANGTRLEYCDYDGVWAANVGDPGYQARWLENVRGRALADGFDGVMLDDTNTFPGHCLGSLGAAIAEYPSDQAYGDATVAFIATVGPGLQAEGLIVAPNIAMNPWDDVMSTQAAAMLPNITHWMREYWMRWDDSENFGGDEWESTLETMQIAQDAGVAYLALTYGPGATGASDGQRYGRASWLLAWDGVSDSAWGYWGDGEEPWSDEWGPDVGVPIEPATQDGGIWVRRYSAGVVVVNPGDADGITVALGQLYVDADLGEVDTVTLDHRTARVLQRP